MSHAFAQFWKSSPAVQVDMHSSTSKGTRRRVHDGLEKSTEADGHNRDIRSRLSRTLTSTKFNPRPTHGRTVSLPTDTESNTTESRMISERLGVLAQAFESIVTKAHDTLNQTERVDVGEKVKIEIDELQSELEHVNAKLEKLNNQVPAKHVVFSSLNKARLRKRVNGSHWNSDAHSIDPLVSFEHEFGALHEDQREVLNEVQDMLKSMEATMKTIRETIPRSGKRSSVARAAIPASAARLRGHDVLVVDLVDHLTAASKGQKQRHICVLGPGGIGKTSVALAVMAHPNVIKSYPGRNRVWVSCKQATSSALFYDTLSSSLGIADKTGSARENILISLKLAGPLIILLDNLETLWNVSTERSELDQMLMTLDAIPHVTLFVTMRSAALPSYEMSWNSVHLKTVDEEAAHQIYSDVYPGGSTDPQVPKLLELFGHLPLAVVLIAKFASLTGLSAEVLIEQYKEKGTRMLSEGLDTKDDLDHCIGLSVDSTPMKRSAEARRLLSALAMLTAGATFQMLQQWWTPGLSNVTALQTLVEACLVERRDSKPPTFVVLPIVQRYILDPSRFDADVCTSMVQSACDFLAHNASHPGNELYKEHRAAIAAEEKNLEAVLLKAVTPSAKIVEALLVLAWHHHFTRPRTEAIELALDLVSQMKGNTKLHADVLTCHGMICSEIGRLEESRKHYAEARRLFVSLSATSDAARCLLHCTNVDVHMDSATPEKMKSNVAIAHSEFSSVNDEDGVARCWFTLSMIAGHSEDHNTALVLLHRARDKYMQLGSHTASVHCLDSIVSHYYHLGDFEQAEGCAISAGHEYDRLGDVIGEMDMTWMLGRIHTAQGYYRAALQELGHYLNWARRSRAPSHVGRALEAMGIAWMQLGEKENARKAFQDALEALRPSRKGGFYQCRYLLRKLDDSNAFPSQEEIAALAKRYPRRMLDLLGV